MINYNSKNWLEAISHFKSSWVIRRTMRMALIMGLIAAAFTALDMQFFPEWEIGIEPAIFSLLGLLLSLLLVFRLNSAYDRWWEGRKQWGALINHTRGLAVLWHGMLRKEDDSNRTFFARAISAYVLALSGHLRDKNNHEQIERYSEESPEHLRTFKHVPNKIVRDMYSRSESLYKDGFIDGFQLNMVQPEMQEFLNIQGACERIKATPIPFAHNFFIKLFVISYCALLPFVLEPIIGWYSILMTMFVSYALVGIEFISVEIEEPFGLDCNDLPTHNLALKIETNVHEILEIPLVKLKEEQEVKAKYLVIT
ncbi:MAG: bestrophin family protein [Bacteroidota bacterium]